MTHTRLHQSTAAQSIPSGYEPFTGKTGRCMIVTETEIRVAIALDGRVMRQGSIEPHVLMVMHRFDRVPSHNPKYDPSRALEVAIYVQAPGASVPPLDALEALPQFFQTPFDSGHCGERSILDLLGKKPGKRAISRIQKIRHAFQTDPDLGSKY